MDASTTTDSFLHPSPTTPQVREPPSPLHPGSGNILTDPIFILGIVVPTIIICTLFLTLSLCYRCRQRRTTRLDVEQWMDTRGTDRDSLKTLVQCACVLCDVRNGKVSAEGSASVRSRSNSSPSCSPTSVRSFQWPAGAGGKHITPPRSPTRTQSERHRPSPRTRPQLPPSPRSRTDAAATATEQAEKQLQLAMLSVPPRARTRSEPGKLISSHVSFANTKPGMF